MIPKVDKDEPPIFIRLDRDMAKRFVERYPDLAKFMDDKQCIVMRLKKYLYGLPQAARHWNIHLRETLIDRGFKQCPVDSCVFQRGTSSRKVRVVVYVDDLLVSGIDNALDLFDKEFHLSYECTGHKGDSISYLSLHIKRLDTGDYVVSSPNTRAELLSKFESDIIKRKITTPSVGTELKTGDKGFKPANNLEPYVNKTKYASLVMTMMYLACMTTADFLLPVTILAGRIQDPSVEDYRAATRLLTYIYHTPNYAILVLMNAAIILKVYTDASHALYGDGKGHGGIIITMGSGYVFAKSGKLKCVTLSSTESESVVMCEGATYIVWMRDLLEFFGYK